MTPFASKSLLAGLTLAMGALFLWSLNDPAQELYLAGASVGLILLSLVMERLRPLHENWNKSTGDTKGDIGIALFLFGALDPVLKLAGPLIVVSVLPAAWVAGWPLIVQILLVTLLIELGAWISHFLHHRWQPLWALHAMHHSPTRLYTLNNLRFHPLNYAVNYAAMILPVLALGFAPEALVAYVALSAPVLILQHTNVGFSFGGWNGVLNTNDLHRWHHSSDPEEGVKNLGRALVIWDRVFGTYYNPATRSEPEAVGLFADSRRFPVASRVLAQLAYPFSRDCCSRA